MGTQVRYQIDNASDRPLYVLLVGLDAIGAAIALHTPLEASTGESRRTLQSIRVEPQSGLGLPRVNNLSWLVSGSPGFVEILAICSIAPFQRALETLAINTDRKNSGDRLIEIANPPEFARAVLADLQAASRRNAENANTSPDTYTLDVRSWVTLQLVYQVV
ncbi:MAG: hypothetical protein HC838_17125 [Spirulinaceae cyanobacterium RM2_2_10]|nr:hypothetical protein [Spirulinaceae cyanobacterium RM2_2_10]